LNPREQGVDRGGRRPLYDGERIIGSPHGVSPPRSAGDITPANANANAATLDDVAWLDAPPH